jgi:hypothetical protein
MISHILETTNDGKQHPAYKQFECAYMRLTIVVVLQTPLNPTLSGWGRIAGKLAKRLGLLALRRVNSVQDA